MINSEWILWSSLDFVAEDKALEIETEEISCWPKVWIPPLVLVLIKLVSLICEVSSRRYFSVEIVHKFLLVEKKKKKVGKRIL